MAQGRYTVEEIKAFLEAPISKVSYGSPLFVDSTATISEAIEFLQTNKTGAILVRDGKNDLAGIFTERDVMNRSMGNDMDIENLSVREIMTSDPETLSETATIAMALNKMHLGHYRRLPLVTKDNRPVGLLSIRNVVQYLAWCLREN